MGLIYQITSPTGRIYVGKTTTSLRLRKASHRHASKKYGTILYNSINKHGWSAHNFSIIEHVSDDVLDEREIFWIKKLNTYWYDNSFGMNMTMGGEGQRCSWMQDISRRKKQSIRFSGSGNPFYGKKHTEEFKKKKSKEVSEYNKRNGIVIPKWGVEKGRAKKIKPVVCYTNDGCFFKEYRSVSDAAKLLNITASCVFESIKYNSWVSGKYLFKYKTDNYKMSIEVGDIKVKTVKRSVICFINSYQIEYPSALEASVELGIPKTTINRAANYNNLRPIRTKHIFIYKDLYHKLNKTAQAN